MPIYHNGLRLVTVVNLPTQVAFVAFCSLAAEEEVTGDRRNLRPVRTIASFSFAGDGDAVETASRLTCSLQEEGRSQTYKEPDCATPVTGRALRKFWPSLLARTLLSRLGSRGMTQRCSAKNLGC
jgi:hypothetical protein